VTGAANIDLAEVAAKLPQIRSHIRLPIGVGFGIRDAQTAKSIASVSDAVVIGSRLVQEIESSSPDRVIGNLSTLLGGIRRAMDEA
jgi:tryptophan synthase alpha chain